MRKSAIILMQLAVLGLVTMAHANVIHVPGQYDTIQEAINAAVDGDTVLVAPGTYFENINFRGRNIVLTSEYFMTLDPSTIENTIINGSTPSNPDTASCVIISSGEDTTAVLQGFTLTGGTGTKWRDEHGAGTYVEGGGVLTQYSSPIIRNNRIVNNEAIRRPSGAVSAGGGAIRVGDGVPRILNNIIMFNSGMYGGGIVLNYTGAIVRNNVIAQNTVYQAVSGAPTFGGGGIWAYNNFGTAQKIIENNTIVENSSTGTGSSFAGRGGGILVSSTTVTTRNNVIWDNTQTTGLQIGVIGGGTANVAYSDVQGGWTGEGNIDQQPVFSDTSYYLSAGSPCIDAGDSSSVYDDPEDPGNPGFARWPSRGGLRNDVGAYGGPGRSVLGLIVTSVREIHGSGVPEEYVLAQNYPNPFNPSTTIEFSLPRSEFTTLRVYDVLGRHVATLVQEELSAGRFSVQWNAQENAGGVYYYKLQAGAFSQVRKTVLLK